MRLDKILWMTRVYKTRNLALEACKKNKVKVNGVKSKPSKMIIINDNILIDKNHIQYQYKITNIPKGRVSAKEVASYLIDLTLKKELDKLSERRRNYTVQFKREKGLGRPTKKDRRIMDKFLKKNV